MTTLAKLSSILKPVSNLWSRCTLAQRFTTLTAVLIVSSLAIFGTILIGVSSHIVNGLETGRVAQQLDTAARQFTDRVRQFRKLPLVLSSAPPIRHIVNLATGETPREGESPEVWHKRLGIIFRSFVEANPSLMQVRFIGVADGGRELVGADRVGDVSKIVDEADLQQIGDRPYFEEALKLRVGDVYLSPIDGNVEKGVVARPLQPTIRAATPIFTRSGNLFGIVIAEASVDTWLRNISELLGPSGDLILANQNRDYLFRSDGGLLVGPSDRSGSRYRHDGAPLDSIFNRDDPNVLTLRESGHLIAARRVAYNPTDPNEFAVLAIDEDVASVFGQARVLGWLGAALTLVFSVTGVMAAYYVSLPLKRLMGAATRIARGELNPTTLMKKGQDVQVGELGQALHIMKQAVERRDASLRKSEGRLRAIVDNTIDGIITIDRRGVIVSYNRGCENIFGYSNSEALGQNLDLLLSGSDANTFYDCLNRQSGSDQDQFIGVHCEFMARHKSGRRIDVEVALAEINVGDEILVSAIFRDISERKKAERLKSEFISTVNHELRTPLTSIIGSLGLLRSGALGPLTEKEERMLNLAHENGARLAKLVNDILDIEKIEAGQIEFNNKSENLKTLIERAAQQDAACAARYGATIVVDDVPSDIVVEVDADRFEEILDNLISNAAKYSPKGGQIEIAAKMTGSTARISVTDHGAGIPAAFRKRIFEKFAQANSSDTRQKSGTGLGLSITKSIVERLGGQIGYKTKPGAGTTFYFDLPARRAAPVEGSARKGEPTMQQDRNLRDRTKDAGHASLPRVLHVESDGDLCTVVAEIVADVADVTNAHSAEEARRLLSEQRFDLVILAIRLPGEPGESVLRYLSERETPAPPVLVYSIDDFSMNAWPMVACALVKSHTDTATLRSHILQLLPSAPQPSPIKRSA